MVGRAGAVLAVLVVVTVAGTAPAGAGVAPATDSTVTRISVAENGTATWEVQIRTRLAEDADVAEYETFQDRFRENTSAFLDPFRDRMRGVVADAANDTGRPMTAREFSSETAIQTVPRRWGVVTYEFQWTAFAATDGDALVVGDVFRGQFFLTENDTLAVAAPDGYDVVATDPVSDASETDTVRWFGRRGFPEDTPAVRFEPRAATTTAAPDTAATPVNGSTPVGGSNGPGTASPVESTTAAGDSGGSSLPLAGAVLLVGLIAIGVYRFYVAPGGDGADSPPGDGPPVPGASGSSTGAANEASTEAEETPNVDSGPVLTDADRVESVLEEAGGQIRQSEIVGAMDWSKSKTSRVLSDMAEAGRIEKLRIGRENVIRTPDSADGPDEVE